MTTTSGGGSSGAGAPRTARQGLTLVHVSAQPEPFLSLKSTETTGRVPQKYSCQAENWTSVSPCRAADDEEEDEEEEEFEIDIEQYDCPLREWITKERTKVEIRKKFSRFLRKFTTRVGPDTKISFNSLLSFVHQVQCHLMSCRPMYQ